MTSRLRWIALAFVPSSLMLGLTTFLTTDVAAVPLFWVVPLTLYLLSFALVFAKRPVLSHALMTRLLPLLALVLVTVMVFASHLPAPIQAPLHLLTFFAAAMVCHGELARSRPTGEDLTQFYLMMSIGGVLGGLFNALVAPIAFRTVVEYPLAIVLACAAGPSRPTDDASAAGHARRAKLLVDVGVSLSFGMLALALMAAFGRRDPHDPLVVVLLYIVPSILCFSFKQRPVRFALSLGALMIASGVYISAREQVPYRGRSFFSVYRLIDDPERHLRMLIHGRTIHGAQSLDPARRAEPLTYYHRTGPIGQAFAAFDGDLAKRRVAVIGLGVGSLAAYARAGEQWTFYEIDPSIAAMARDRRYFTFLSDAKTDIRVVLGDARISLEKEPARTFDLLVVDAFGSDAIPIHLLTKEALQAYWRTLDDRGVLAFHISNRYIDLQPLLGDLARDAGLSALAQDDIDPAKSDVASGKHASRWVLVTRTLADVGPLANDSRWKPIARRNTPIVWTDDFSNPLALMRWF